MRDANGVAIAKYSYDGEGKRVKKEVIAMGETTIFVYSSGKLVAEYSTATPSATPQVNYTTADQLGSPRVITDQLGQVISSRDFLPFGEELYADGVHRSVEGKYSLNAQDGVRQRFTGYEKDLETGLDFAEAVLLFDACLLELSLVLKSEGRAHSCSESFSNSLSSFFGDQASLILLRQQWQERKSPIPTNP